MDGNSSWKSCIVSDRLWLAVLLTMSSSHLQLFISRPTHPFLMMAALLSTVWVTTDTSVIKVPSIKVWFDLGCNSMNGEGKKSRAKRVPLLHPSGWVKVEISMKERCFWRITVPNEKVDLFSGRCVWAAWRTVSRRMLLKAFLTSSFSKTFSPCFGAMKERVAWTAASQGGCLPQTGRVGRTRTALRCKVSSRPLQPGISRYILQRYVSGLHCFCAVRVVVHHRGKAGEQLADVHSWGG